jgi:hypothetical protein
MVDVAVGVEHHGRSEPTRFYALHDPCGLLTRIYHGEDTRIAVTKKNAIRLDRTDWEHIEEKINHEDSNYEL